MLALLIPIWVLSITEENHLFLGEVPFWLEPVAVQSSASSPWVKNLLTQEPEEVENLVSMQQDEIVVVAPGTTGTILIIHLFLFK